MTYNKPGDYTPSDFLLLNGNLLISGCCDSCPYATLAPGQGDISNDTSEAEYLCGLMGGKKVWGESPECSLADWLKVVSFSKEAKGAP